MLYKFTGFERNDLPRAQATHPCEVISSSRVWGDPLVNYFILASALMVPQRSGKVGLLQLPG